MKTFLTSTDIQAMIDIADNLRDKMLIAFYADSGARVSELLKIKILDIDFEQNVVLIPHLKRGLKKMCPNCKRAAGRSQPFCSHCGYDLKSIVPEGIEERSRLINIGRATTKLIREYLDDRGTNSPYLINLTRQRVYYIIRELAARVGLGGKSILNPESGKRHYVHPHILRDSLAVDWLTMAEGNITKQKALQMQLGHQKFDTTMRYFKLNAGQVSNVSEEVREKRRFNLGKTKKSGKKSRTS